jgi:hypothetical protein
MIFVKLYEVYLKYLLVNENRQLNSFDFAVPKKIISIK